ncbi:MAG: helix-turn-helix domain-containing protein [bacterium]|nr:helix-turn-helix domain-containing protein [bacterium]
MKRSASASQKAILDAAQRLFSAQGFEKTSVSALAQEAGVNKALIYYYFQDKKGLLSALMQRLQEQIYLGIQDIADQSQGDRKRFEEAMLPFVSDLLERMEKQTPLWRILLRQSLDEDTAPPLLEFATPFLQDPRKTEELLQAGLLDAPLDLRDFAAEFFTSLMPLLGYLVFRHAWSARFGVPLEQLRSHFLWAYERTHMAYHKNRWKEES